MENNFNPNGENGNERPSDSLYSYSYIKKEEPKEEQGEPQGAEQSTESNTIQGTESSTTQGTENSVTQSVDQNIERETYQSAESSMTQSSEQGTYQSSTQYQQAYSPCDAPRNNPPKKKKKGGFGKMLGKCAAIALVFGLVSGTVFYGTGAIFDYATGKDSKQNTANHSDGYNSAGGNKVTTTSTNTKAVVSDVSDVVENAMPAIVSITNLSVQQYQTIWGQTINRESTGAGSGIIVAQTDEYLYIVTNNHVVEGSTALSVIFVDDQTVAAEIKGVDASTDLAVVQVPISSISADTLSKIKVAMLGSSDNLRVGEPAIAIGNALGYGQSVTTGVISALNREVTVTDSNNKSITNSLIQTDAAINPGNSGGALLNIKGEVIGINEVKYSDTNVEGMGYAIPISTAESIINDLITREVVQESETAFLGVSGQNVTEDVSGAYGMPVGIYVTKVTPGSAAEKAGIKLGDIITAFDGRTVDTMEALAERMQYYKAGTTVDVTVMTVQNGQWTETTISVTLGKKN